MATRRFLHFGHENGVNCGIQTGRPFAMSVQDSARRRHLLRFADRRDLATLAFADAASALAVEFSRTKVIGPNRVAGGVTYGECG
jgi:hypothetical protein